MKSLEGSRPGPRLPDSPATPCSQQDNKIKQEPKTPIVPRKTQVCVSVRRDAVPHVVAISPFLICVFFNPHLLHLTGCEVEEYGFLGQPGSEVPINTSLLNAFLKRQLRTVQTGRQGERGERETTESTG